MVAVGCGGLSNEDWNDTAVRVVVISPTGEVWCGVGSHAESLGIFTDAAVMAAQIADRCDTPSVRRWHDTPTVHIYHAATPGWASLDGLTPETVPLADIETVLTL